MKLGVSLSVVIWGWGDWAMSEVTPHVMETAVWVGIAHWVVFRIAMWVSP